MNADNQVIQQLRKGSIYFASIMLLSIIFLIPQSASAQLFGDGTDGSHTVIGVEHLASDMNYTDLNISAGAVLETHGFNVRVSGTLTNAGIIRDNFSGGSGGSFASGGSGSNFNGGNGSSGNAGTPGVGGAGNGGNSGGGGGGGGGARDTNDGYSASGGNGGAGQWGGKGGGIINIFAREINNLGVIQANGFNGLNGSSGGNGAYRSYNELLVVNRDLAGGGGGGGGGGNGGNGGTVTIVYETPTTLGSVTAIGGNGGSGGSGGNGRNTQYNAGGSTIEYPGGSGNTFDANGGNGGRGEISSVSSTNGNSGQAGFAGAAGTVNLIPSIICYDDADSDGFGDAADSGYESVSCGAGSSDNNFDCDDNDASINPDAVEITADGIDQNCDGADICFADNDNDGFGSNSTVASADIDCSDVGESDNSNDCNDGDASTYPGATEIIGDGVDQDCNGFEACYADTDGDGFGSNAIIPSIDFDCFDATESDNNADCDDADNTIYPGAVEIPADGIDQNCDGFEICYNDSDDDGYGDVGTVGSTDLNCSISGVAPNGDDCDDNDNSIYPGAIEIVDNGIDEDCDGVDASCCIDPTGDINNDGGALADISDLLFLVDYMFLPPGTSPSPVCMKEADVNGDGGATPDISDLLYLVDYMFLPPGTAPAPAGCL